MGKYTPPDIAEEIYSYLNPGDAFMLRGLVAKWNGIASNCIRMGAAPEAIAQSQVTTRDPVAAINETERLFNQFHAKASENAVVQAASVPVNVQTARGPQQTSLRPQPEVRNTGLPARPRPTPTTQDAFFRGILSGGRTGLREEYQRWAQVTSPSDSRYTLVLKYLLQGDKTIHELSALMTALKPGFGDGVIPAILWRFGKIDVIKKATRTRAPKYTIGDGFWADNGLARTKHGIR